MSRKLRELKTKYSVNERSANLINRIDPTTNKKYVEWLFKVRYVKPTPTSKYRIAGDFPASKEEDIRNALSWFERNSKGKVPAEYRDINKFKTITEFLTKTKEWATPSRKEIRESVKVVFEDERFKVVIPLTFESSRLYGSGTKWCTTQNTYYKSYMKDGTLYYIIDKTINRKFGLSLKDSYGRNPVESRFTFYNNEDRDLNIPTIKKVYGNVFDPVLNAIKKDFSNTLDEKLKKKAINNAIEKVKSIKRDLTNTKAVTETEILSLLDTFISRVEG